MEIGEYIAYLMSSSTGNSCVKASEIIQVSHDKVNRFLLEGRFNGWNLFNAVSKSIDLQGGTVNVDDTVLDKPYTRQGTTELVAKFYSGKHHRTVKGINLVVLVYTTPKGYSVPVNFRIYRKSDGKTKNQYFQDMFKELWNWGLRPKWVTADSWYASADNMRFLRNYEINFMMGLDVNRLISNQPAVYEQIQNIQIPESGLFTHLNGFDWVQVFQTVSKDGDVRHYALYQQQDDTAHIELFTREQFEKLHTLHWRIENFFRGIKQCCNAEKFFVRNTNAIKTHLYCVLRAFQKLASLTLNRCLDSIYDLRNLIFREAQRQFINDFA